MKFSAAILDWFYVGYCTVMAMFAIAAAYAAAFVARSLDAAST